ncbi:MAG TPA: hypothetical protein VKK81_19580 [Candidatus Binatia bacterium]|nr:hypothetical protein [Candidatus Binatia bacterium]
MQHVQKLGPLTGQRPSVAPLRVTTVRPSVWERVRAWAERTLTSETVAEIVLATVTISLTGSLLFSLYRALENYTIIPLP